MARGIVSPRLDYCNGLLYGTSTRNLDRLQVAQNTLARVVCKSSATELRRLLHWLPIRQLNEYKLALMTYKTRVSGVSAYLADFSNDYQPIRQLRSSDRLLLIKPTVFFVVKQTIGSYV
jgi:hypothetical protein